MGDTLSAIPIIMFNFRLSAKSGQTTFRAILDYARRHGPWQCLAMQDCGEITGLEPWDKRISGIIASGGSSREASLKFARSGIPVVLMDPEQGIGDDHPLAHCPGVRCDSRAIGAMAARHYLECGYRAFAWVGESGGYRWSADRSLPNDAILSLISWAFFSAHSGQKSPSECTSHTKSSLSS